MASGEKSPTLWNRYGNSLQRRKGELYPQVTSAKAVFEEAQKLRILKKHEGDPRHLYTPIYAFELTGTGGKNMRYFRTEAHMEPDGEALMFAVTEYPSFHDKKELEKHHYQANPDGTIVVFEEDFDGVPGKETHVPVARTALERIAYRLQMDIDDEQSRRHERRVRNGRILSGIGAVAVAGGLVFLGVKTWVLDPQAAAEERRLAYDEQPHQLPGEGVVIDYNSFEMMPVSEFNKIPSFGGSDTDFDNPRTVRIEADNSCVTLSGDFDEGETIYVALPEGSQYAGYHYGTTIRDDRVSICLVEALDPQSEESVKIAVQIN